MQIIREKVYNNNSDINLKFSFESRDNIISVQQEIDKLIGKVSDDLVNPITDIEKRKFKYLTTSYANIKYFFGDNNSFGLDGAGFTLNEISNNSSNFINSFFIFDIFDDYNPNTQIKISTTYLTKLNDIPDYLIGVDLNNSNKYSNIQFTHLYIPQWYIDANINNTPTIYGRFSFYNAKSGQTTLFYNNDLSSLLTPEKMYFKIVLNVENRIWFFNDMVNNTINAKEVVNNVSYINKINNTLTKKDNYKQIYPTGSTGGTIFDYNTGKYR